MAADGVADGGGDGAADDGCDATINRTWISSSASALATSPAEFLTGSWMGVKGNGLQRRGGGVDGGTREGARGGASSWGGIGAGGSAGSRGGTYRIDIGVRLCGGELRGVQHRAILHLGASQESNAPLSMCAVRHHLRETTQVSAFSSADQRHHPASMQQAAAVDAMEQAADAHAHALLAAQAAMHAAVEAPAAARAVVAAPVAA